MDIIGEMVLFTFIVSTVLAALIILAILAGLEACRRLSVWLYQAVKPTVIEMWEDWQRERTNARKPQDIQAAGAATRREMDQILARYSEQVDQVLGVEQPDRYLTPDVILLFGDSFKIMEVSHVN